MSRPMWVDPVSGIGVSIDHPFGYALALAVQQANKDAASREIERPGIATARRLGCEQLWQDPATQDLHAIKSSEHWVLPFHARVTNPLSSIESIGPITGWQRVASNPTHESSPSPHEPAWEPGK